MRTAEEMYEALQTVAKRLATDDGQEAFFTAINTSKEEFSVLSIGVAERFNLNYGAVMMLLQAGAFLVPENSRPSESLQ
jgi:hypothetical protein